jgi:hypothetical protein
MVKMFHKRFALLLLVLVLVFLLIFPGMAMAQDNSTQETNLSAAKNTLTIEVPGQVETGQTLTLTALLKDNEYDEPVANAQVVFFVESDFFIKNLMEIGTAVTDTHGLAKIDYIPNQPGIVKVVASYKAGSNFKPVQAESTVNITGSTKEVYKTLVGIQFPNSFLLWIIAVVILLSAIWCTFLYVLYQVRRISGGTGSKAALIFMIVVAVLFTVMVMVIVTPEAQYNFGFLPKF